MCYQSVLDCYSGLYKSLCFLCGKCGACAFCKMSVVTRNLNIFTGKPEALRTGTRVAALHDPSSVFPAQPGCPTFGNTHVECV